MLWLEPVIGTAPWCWWQVPARRYQRRVGVLRARLTVGRLGSSLPLCLPTLRLFGLALGGEVGFGLG